MTYPDLTSFGHDPWWLIIAKALLVFVFLLLTGGWFGYRNFVHATCAEPVRISIVAAPEIAPAVRQTSAGSHTRRSTASSTHLASAQTCGSSVWCSPASAPSSVLLT